MKYKCPVCGKVIGVTEDIMDQQVVERFNGLVKEDRIRVVVKGNEADKHIVTEDNEYRLLPPEPPKPQYRKFDPDKDDFVLSDFCEQQIHHDGEPMRTNAVIDSINRAGVMARVYDAKGCRPVLKLITWAALAESWRRENGEPFGQKVSE